MTKSLQRIFLAISLLGRSGSLVFCVQLSVGRDANHFLMQSPAKVQSGQSIGTGVQGEEGFSRINMPRLISHRSLSSRSQQVQLERQSHDLSSSQVPHGYPSTLPTTSALLVLYSKLKELSSASAVVSSNQHAGHKTTNFYNPRDYVIYYYDKGGLAIGSALEDPSKRVAEDDQEIFQGMVVWDSGEAFHEFVQNSGCEELQAVYAKSLSCASPKPMNKVLIDGTSGSSKTGPDFLSVVQVGVDYAEVSAEKYLDDTSGMVDITRPQGGVEAPFQDVRNRIRQYFPEAAKTLFSNLYQTFILIPDVDDSGMHSRDFEEVLAAFLFEIINAASRTSIYTVVDKAKDRASEFLPIGPEEFAEQMELNELDTLISYNQIVGDMHFERSNKINTYTEDGVPGVGSRRDNTDIDSFLQHEFVGSFHAFTYVVQWCDMTRPASSPISNTVLLSSTNHTTTLSSAILVPETSARARKILEKEWRGRECPKFMPGMLRVQDRCSRVVSENGRQKASIFMMPPHEVVLCFSSEDNQQE